ncbi:MAG: 30S ribosome-binding factor RbfA [Bacteroidetes bacterium]|nr:30S ribosome-binding factor RbfA [Bacteroidota bacterium]
MSVRTQRVARLMHREMADILAREFPDQSMVTVTGVRVTRDLSIVYVDLSIMLDSAEERQTAFDVLVSQTAAVRKFLAQRIRHQVRAVPDIRFFLDNSQDQVRKLDTLFAQIKDQDSRA